MPERAILQPVLRTLILGLIWMASGVGLASEPAAAVDSAFTVRELAPGVFVHLGKQLPLDAPGHDDIANIGFIVGQRFSP